jgi:hypothetical protein
MKKSRILDLQGKCLAAVGPVNDAVEKDLLSMSLVGPAPYKPVQGPGQPGGQSHSSVEGEKHSLPTLQGISSETLMLWANWPVSCLV